MSGNSKRYRTQWSAQFYAAAELTRRGYLAALTLGNAPVVDLLVQSPGGVAFQVDLKGLSSKNFWLVRERPAKPDLFFILVYLPSDVMQPPQFFIVPSATLVAEMTKLRERTIVSGRDWNEAGAGINWGTGLQFRDRWDYLPG